MSLRVTQAVIAAAVTGVVAARRCRAARLLPAPPEPTPLPAQRRGWLDELGLTLDEDELARFAELDARLDRLTA